MKIIVIFVKGETVSILKYVKWVLVAWVLGALVSTANDSIRYECWAYNNGTPLRMVYISADNDSDAVRKAWEKFRNVIQFGPDSVKCK